MLSCGGRRPGAGPLFSLFLLAAYEQPAASRPLGEERTFWQAPEVYNAMPPFNKMTMPLLLINGEAGHNSGIFPLQSERYFAARKGPGATARYMVLPAEAHDYATRENLLHMLCRG